MGLEDRMGEALWVDAEIIGEVSAQQSELIRQACVALGIDTETAAIMCHVHNCSSYLGVGFFELEADELEELQEALTNAEFDPEILENPALLEEARRQAAAFEKMFTDPEYRAYMLDLYLNKIQMWAHAQDN